MTPPPSVSFSKKCRNSLVGFIGSMVIRIIGPTLRMHIVDESGITSNPSSPKPIVFAFWHNRMFLMPYLYRHYLPGRRVVCLISASQDGEMIAKVLQRCGIGAVRGSSSRRGSEALRELTENLKRGMDVAITPDGPRGPCYQAHMGVVGLAALSSSQLIPVSYQLNWKIELPTWDRFIIPLPFSKCRIHLSKAIEGSTLTTEELNESARTELERKLCVLG